MASNAVGGSHLTGMHTFIYILVYLHSGKEADFAAWSQMFWARVLEGKLPPCDEDKKEGTKRKKGCGSGDACCSEKKKKVAENGEV